ncbi:MAG: mechanosensitive ion channel family protein, partial [Coriobacteriia bacterium]|nr:mechanosensitive ion channel family protein [Coriobacteriia bacterium]
MDDVIEVSSDGIWLWLTPLIGFAVAMAAALVVATVVSALLRLVGRKRSWPTLLQTRVLPPLRTTLVVLALWIAALVTLDPRLDPLPGIVDYILMIATIAACGWLLASVVLFFVDLALSRHPIDMPDNRSQRRVRTQILIVRRVVIAVVVVLTL